jgi:hypothetical protein
MFLVRRKAGLHEKRAVIGYFKQLTIAGGIAWMAVTCALWCGCVKSPSDGTSTGTKYTLDIYTMNGSIYYSTADSCAQYSVSLDNMQDIPQSDFSATIDGKPMGVYQNGSYHWETCTPYTDGQKLHVVFSHKSWGTKEFDLVIADAPDTFIYSPDLDSWLERIQDNDPNNDSLRISWPPTLYCNDFWGLIEIFNFGPSVFGTLQGSSLFFQNAASDSRWRNLKDSIFILGSFSTLVTTSWKQDIPWNDVASIHASCTGIQTGKGKRIPVNVAGVYDCIANYTAYNAGFSVIVTNETEVFSINQTGAALSISGKSGVTGSVDGKNITLTGDILSGAGAGGSQTFYGTASGNSIQGFFSGTVMAQFSGTGQPVLSSVSSGSLSLIKRN